MVQSPAEKPGLLLASKLSDTERRSFELRACRENLGPYVDSPGRVPGKQGQLVLAHQMDNRRTPAIARRCLAIGHNKLPPGDWLCAPFMAIVQRVV
jgi:hypothetical protein